MYLSLNNKKKKKSSTIKIEESFFLCLVKEYKLKNIFQIVDLKGNFWMNVSDIRDGNKRGSETWYSLYKEITDIKEEKWSWVTMKDRFTRT